MFQVVDEGIGGALEINVVVPERVIRVDENRLAFGLVRVHDSIFVLDLETYVDHNKPFGRSILSFSLRWMTPRVPFVAPGRLERICTICLPLKS